MTAAQNCRKHPKALHFSWNASNHFCANSCNGSGWHWRAGPVFRQQAAHVAFCLSRWFLSWLTFAITRATFGLLGNTWQSPSGTALRELWEERAQHTGQDCQQLLLQAFPFVLFPFDFNSIRSRKLLFSITFLKLRTITCPWKTDRVPKAATARLDRLLYHCKPSGRKADLSQAALTAQGFGKLKRKPTANQPMLPYRSVDYLYKLEDSPLHAHITSVGEQSAILYLPFKVAYLNAFSVLFIKRPNIKSIRCIHFSSGRNQWGRILERRSSVMTDQLIDVI